MTAPSQPVSQPVPATDEGADQPGRTINWGKIAFLGLILLGFCIYTQMAFEMEWRTVAGRIGPGYFPRLLGGLAITVTLAAMVAELLAKPKKKELDAVEAAEEAAEPDLGRHPKTLVAFVIAAAVFVGLFGFLGAALAGIVFLAVTLWFLDPEHRVRGMILAVAVPVLLYLAFQTGLNVGLPQGILPIG